MQHHPAFPSRVMRAVMIGLPGIMLLPVTLTAPAGIPVVLLLVNPLILLVLAAVAGAWAAPKAGLRSALVCGNRLDLQTIAGFAAAGALAGLVVALADHFAAPLWATGSMPTLLQERSLSDLFIGLLYGGLTEEVMLRWGLMSLLAVGALRLFSGKTALWSANLLAALGFAALHLPAVMLEAETLTTALVTRTLLWNTGLGLLFGLAFIRGGLESAVGAHIGFHLGVAGLAATLAA